MPHRQRPPHQYFSVLHLHDNYPWLDEHHTVFGHVESFDVLDAIEEVLSRSRTIKEEVKIVDCSELLILDLDLI